jgi:hypothetical protein
VFVTYSCPRQIDSLHEKPRRSMTDDSKFAERKPPSGEPDTDVKAELEEQRCNHDIGVRQV